MCELCSDDKSVRDKESSRLHAVADKLLKLSNKYDKLAAGRMKPHGEDAANMGRHAREIIRDLVIDWV